MKYRCMNDICEAQFDHPGTRKEYDFNCLPYLQAKEKTFIHPGDNVLVAVTEYLVCPYCGNKGFDVEPEADITSVKSVPLEDVDAWLKDGYIVKELYAKTATLVKRELPAPKDPESLMKDAIRRIQNPDPDDNQAIIEANQHD